MTGFAGAVPSNATVSRIADIGPLQRWLSQDGHVGKLVRAQIGERAHPVRAILFDKNETSNWSLGWHQDRTIAVGSRHDVHGFGPWTVKQGIHHVEPPFGLIERMVTARIHLDPVDSSNAPLLVSTGTHRLGRLEESRIPAAVDTHGVVACTAAAGDVWLYKTPIVHASARAEPGPSPTRPAGRL